MSSIQLLGIIHICLSKVSTNGWKDRAHLVFPFLIRQNGKRKKSILPRDVVLSLFSHDELAHTVGTDSEYLTIVMP